MGLRGKHHQRSSQIKAPYVASIAIETEEKEDQMARSTA